MSGVAMGSTYDLTMPSEEYLDLGDTTELQVHTNILSIVNATLTLQTAMNTEGPWTDVQSYTGPTDTTILVTSEVDTDFDLQRFLRWEMEAPSSTWRSSFRIGVKPKRGSLKSNVRLPVDIPEKGEVELTEWTAYKVGFTASSTAPVVQDRNEWVDTDEMRYLVLETEALLLSAATLVLENAFSDEGPWTQIAAYTQAYTVDRVVLSWQPSGAVPALARYIRWHLEGTPGAAGVAWEACFRVQGKWS